MARPWPLETPTIPIKRQRIQKRSPENGTQTQRRHKHSPCHEIKHQQPNSLQGFQRPHQRASHSPSKNGNFQDDQKTNPAETRSQINNKQLSTHRTPKNSPSWSNK